MKDFNIQSKELKLEEITSYCDYLQEKGRQDATITAYRSTLMELYAFLAEDKIITQEIINQWVQSLKENNKSEKTITHRLSTIKNFLRYLNGVHVLRVEPENENKTSVEITRHEYLRLLQAAKIRGDQKIYLLIKVFGTIGISLQELSNLTLESVKQGYIPTENKILFVNYYIPKALQTELLNYAAENGIYSGPIFLNKRGKPESRFNVVEMINRISKDAQVAEEKANPRCLKKLCTQAQNKIFSEYIMMAQILYDKMIDSEQDIYGWEQ